LDKIKTTTPRRGQKKKALYTGLKEISMSIKEDSIVGVILKVLKDRPDFILMVIVVGGFLYHMDAKDQRTLDNIKQENLRADLVASHRIESCHELQHKSHDVIDKNSAAILEHSKSNVKLSEEIDTLTIVVSGNTESIRSMEMAVQKLIDAVGHTERMSMINSARGPLPALNALGGQDHTFRHYDEIDY
jgi:hypothetical protein